MGMKRNIARDILKDKIFLKNLFSLAFPIALQSLMLALVGASDTIMLGSLDQNSMSAVSLATQLQFVQNLTISGVIAAFHVLGAQYAGKGDKNSVDMLLAMTLRISVLVSILTFILCFLYPEFAMSIYTDEAVLIEKGSGYLRIASFSYLLTGVTQCFLALLKLEKNTVAVARISGTAVVLNIGLNALLIFGLGPIPPMGVEGAAWATVWARIVETALTIYAVWSVKKIRPDLGNLFKFNRTLSRDYIRQLIPLLGAYLVWTLGISSYSAFLGHMGVDAAAASSLSQVVRNLVLSFTRGLAGGASIMVGYELGKGNLDLAKEYGLRLSILSLVCGVITAFLVLLFIPLGPLVVHLSPGATGYYREISLILSLYVIGAAFNSVVINGMFASGGDTMFDFYSIIVVMWGISIPLAFMGTFFFNWSVGAVFFCTCLDEVGKIPWTVHHYRKYKWLKDLTTVEKP